VTDFEVGSQFDPKECRANWLTVGILTSSSLMAWRYLGPLRESMDSMKPIVLLGWLIIPF
jgi:hypothetical protein